MSWTEWVAVAASIATICTAIAVFITVLIYHRQLRAMNRARDLDSLLVMMSYADNTRLRQARYLMLEHGDELRELLNVECTAESRNAIDFRIRELNSDGLGIHDIDLSLNALNNTCYFIRYEYAPDDAVETLLTNTLLHAWQAFEPYIRYRRTRRDTEYFPSRYAEHFEWVIAKIRSARR